MQEIDNGIASPELILLWGLQSNTQIGGNPFFFESLTNH